jgi:precorrin-6A synthase
MRKITLIGIGAGDPEQLTLQAVRELKSVDVIFLTEKRAETADLVEARKAICARYLTDRPYRTVTVEDPPRTRNEANYGESVREWHDRRGQLYERLIEEQLADGECGAFLVWGDPSLYDSTLRIMDTVKARGRVAFDCQVIPGISSLQLLAARHRISLHEIGEPVLVTTGRKLRDEDFDSNSSVVVMLDGKCAFGELKRCDLLIYWGAYLGTPSEILISGPLGEVGGRIRDARAAARELKGWIMDIYLLRRK